MADDNVRRLNRLAKRAKELDDMIEKAAQMQKRIVTEIQRIGNADKQIQRRLPAVPKARRKKSRRA